MKKIFLLAAVGTGSLVSAQSPLITYNAHAVLDTNQIETRVNALGDMWWDPSAETFHCEYPAGSNKQLATAGALWMSTYDPDGVLHVAAQTYRQTGMDYGAGPAHLTWSEEEMNKWGKVWKITRSDIQTFLSHTTHTLANTPPAILEWPAKDNPYAKVQTYICKA